MTKVRKKGRQENLGKRIREERQPSGNWNKTLYIASVIINSLGGFGSLWPYSAQKKAWPAANGIFQQNLWGYWVNNGKTGCFHACILIPCTLLLRPPPLPHCPHLPLGTSKIIRNIKIWIWVNSEVELIKGWTWGLNVKTFSWICYESKLNSG